MQIHRLQLRNFRQHENTDLEFGTGLTGIVGLNGAGKTTILEAIAWAMYGMPAARGNRETIRRRGAPPRARVEVELEFSLGHHQYRIFRSLNTAELYQDGDPTPIANSIGAVTDRVTRLLSMSKDEFFNTYFTDQKELAVMARLSAPERAQFLSRVLGYEKIREAQDQLKEKRSALRARLDALRVGLADPAELDAAEARANLRLAAARKAETAATELLALADFALSEVRPRWERLQQLREMALAQEAEIRVANHQVSAATDRAARLEQQVNEGTAAARKLEEIWGQLEPLPRLRAEAQALEQQSESWRLQQGLVAQQREVRAQLASVEERMSRMPDPAALETARERVDEVRASLTAVTLEGEAVRTAWVRDAQDAQTKRQGLLDQYQELKDQRQSVISAGPDGVCPTCARPLGAEYATVLELLDGQIEAVVANGNFYKQRIEQLQVEPRELDELDRRRLAMEKELSEATGELGRLNAQAQETGRLRDERERLVLRVSEIELSLDPSLGSYDSARHLSLVAEIRGLEPLALRAERLRAVGDRTAALAAELEAVRSERDMAAALVADLTSRLAALEYSEAVYRETREAEALAAHARREAELALVRARGESGAAFEGLESVARRRAERAAREREAATVASELALHQELDRSFTDLRTDLNADLRPDLSDLGSEFLRQLTNGRYTDLELDEDYCTTLMEGGDAKAVISSGEQDVANLALRLAISQMIAERAGQPLSLLVLDEIFGSLDDERRVAVVDLLRALGDRFPQVIFITHVETVGREFDRVVRVTYDATRGVSIVRDEPLGGEDVAA
ncbi:MAG: AAA family ATPase [Gemmatimonadales bacterium]